MKSIFTLLLALVLSNSIYAATYNYTYTCSQKNQDFSFDVQIDSKKMTLLKVAEGNGSDKFGNLGYLNQGFVGGNGRMSNQLKFTYSKPDSNISNFNFPNTFFVQPELLSGGSTLHIGKLGGFISFVGQAYTYESYLCVRK